MSSSETKIQLPHHNKNEMMKISAGKHLLVIKFKFQFQFKINSFFFVDTPKMLTNMMVQKKKSANNTYQNIAMDRLRPTTSSAHFAGAWCISNTHYTEIGYPLAKGAHTAPFEQILEKTCALPCPQTNTNTAQKDPHSHQHHFVSQKWFVKFSFHV